MYKYVIIILFFAKYSSAQDVSGGIAGSQDDVVDDSQISDRVGPGIEGTPPPKFFTVSYVNTSPFGLTSMPNENSEEWPTGETRVKKYEEIYIKLKYPILLKPNTRVLGGIQYRYHEYRFAEGSFEDNNLFKYLDNKHLTQLRFDFYFTHSFKNSKNYLLVKSGIKFAGDFRKNEIGLSHYTSHSTSALFGFKPKPNLAWGFGTYLSTSKNRFSIYPAILFNYWPTKKWGIESLFPAVVNFVWRPAKNGYLSVGYGLSTSRYTVDPPQNIMTSTNKIVMNRIDVKFGAEWQQQIYKFIWGSISGGYLYNYRLEFNESNSRSVEPALESKLGDAFLFEASIHLTIPQNIRNREQNK